MLKCTCDEEKPFIFISYAHRDSEKVIGIIRRLMKDGYNVWYDEGIDPGTEWDDNIANHIVSSAYFIGFISENYIRSSNCKDELKFSRDLEKEQLLVYIGETQLPSGMAMRMNRLQSIFWDRYEKEEDAFTKLYSAKGIERTLIAPVQAVVPVKEVQSTQEEIPVKTAEPAGEEIPVKKEPPKLAASQKPAEKKPVPMKKVQYMKCLFCGATLIQGSERCTGCGKPQYREEGACYYCGKRLTALSPNYCISCNKPMPDLDVLEGKKASDVVSQEAQKHKESVLCRACGAKMSPEATECPICYAKVIKMDTSANSNKLLGKLFKKK